jgi:nucleotide-binding universal stress UspA family protein
VWRQRPGVGIFNANIRGPYRHFMKTNKMRIVCGTDFSVHAAQASTVAALLAARLNETLILMHAVEGAGLDPVAPEVRDAQVARAQDKLHREAERLRKLGPTVREELCSGSPSERLVEAGQTSTTRLMIVSSLGRIAPSRFLVGSVAERTAEHSPIPTLIVRDSAPFEAWARGERPLRILAGYDFSPSSDAALDWIGELQRIGPCEVTVAYVAWPPREGGRLGLGETESRAELSPEIQKYLERDLKEKVILRLGEKNVGIRVAASWGRPDPHLIQLASETQADLIVVGTHQRQGLSRYWLGSVSRAILHHAPASVAVVPAAEASPPGIAPIPEFKRVLVTTDFSDLGNRAIPYAYSALDRGGRVCLLHVVPPSAGKSKGPGSAGRLDPLKDKLQSLFPSESEQRGIETEVTIVEHAEPATAICQAAERFGADLICLSSHGRSGLAKTILGSVAQAVMSRSVRPVLVVRSPKV